MVLPQSFSRKMGEIETVEAEKMGWLDLPRGTSYPTFPYLYAALSAPLHCHATQRSTISPAVSPVAETPELVKRADTDKHFS